LLFSKRFLLVHNPQQGEASGAKWPVKDLKAAIKAVCMDVLDFASEGSGICLRTYQREAAQAIVKSVKEKQGLTFVVIFPRQSGKNELQAQIEAYLMAIYSEMQSEIVKVSPTWKPQSLNAMRRLERVLDRNLVTRSVWEKEQGYIYRMKGSRIFFLSGAPTANVVGATASTLLECDEAQDVLTGKWDKEVQPMAASTNATRVFWGTAWTSKTLLAREMRAALKAEKKDGTRRVFRMTAEDVAAEVPAYKKFVAEEVRKHGRNHPFIKTQYYSEEIDSEGGMFPAVRQALMVGGHARLAGPAGDGLLYALLVDVAGQDENAPAPGEEAGALANPKRDSTAMTVVEIDLSRVDAIDPYEMIGPIYRVVDRCEWIGVAHTQLYGQLRALFEHWQASYMVVDATGVGAGLASFLDKALPGKVIPFVFSSSSKSKLGWDFLSIIETGRFLDWKAPRDGRQDERSEFWRQVDLCELKIYPGPERRIAWGVPDGTRDPVTGELVHDDLLISAALVAQLEGLDWGVGASEIIDVEDPLAGMMEAF
jgi:Terminase RNaseH-like domain